MIQLTAPEQLVDHNVFVKILSYWNYTLKKTSSSLTFTSVHLFF